MTRGKRRYRDLTKMPDDLAPLSDADLAALALTPDELAAMALTPDELAAMALTPDELA